MSVSYKKMFKLMIDKDIKKKDLKEMTGLSYSTIAKMERGENLQMDVLEKVCKNLDCTFDDIVEIKND